MRQFRVPALVALVIIAAAGQAIVPDWLEEGTKDITPPPPGAPKPNSAITPKSSSIQKVVMLLTEMKTQVEKDATTDKEAYDKYKCWCETTRKEKEAAIEIAEQRIAEIEAFLEQAAGLEGQLKTEVAGLEQDIADDEDALATATAQREKEAAEFAAEEKDLKACLAALAEAIEVLSKVQLLQKTSGGALPEKAKPLLLQVYRLVQQVPSSTIERFHGVMQKDLFDALDALNAVATSHGAFLPRRSQRHALSAIKENSRLLPWEKTDEEKGMEAKPNDLMGASQFKNYNSRSGQIFGILTQMEDDFKGDLSQGQKEELEAMISFYKLQAAKLGEIAAAKEAKDKKETELADLAVKVARSKDELGELKVAMAADQQILIQLAKACTEADEEYAKRSKIRSEEIIALGEVLKILTSDEARDLFGRSIMLLQVQTSTEVVQRRAVEKALLQVLHAARKSKDLMLASMAVRSKLDSFTKVKEMMDKMLEELKAQQKVEYEKWEYCKKEIDQTEDTIKETEHIKKDLEEKKLGLENTIETLNAEIESLKEDTAAMEVSLKQAGEQRKEENLIFQTSVADQRATVTILKKALTRMQEFYNKKQGLMQVRQEPGAPTVPPPPKPEEYRKAENSGGIMQLLAKIIADAESEEVNLIANEQHSQEAYSAFAKDATNSIEANRAAVSEKEEAVATAEGELSETEAALLANAEELTKLGELLNGLHVDCDWLLKYFDLRQKARQEEMNAIVEAKAILSGADFGR